MISAAFFKLLSLTPEAVPLILAPNEYVPSASLTSIRKALADIEIEEQNHAEMLYKYKMANGMQ